MSFKNSISYFFIKSGSGLIGLLTVYVFTHILNPEDYGSFSIIMSFTSIVSAIFFQWISMAVGRFFIDGKQKDRQKILSTAAICLFFLFFLLTFLFWIVKPYLGHYFPAINLWILLMMIFSYSWFEINLRISNSSHNPLSYGLLIFVRTFFVLFIGVELYRHLGILGIFYASIFSSVDFPKFFKASPASLRKSKLKSKAIVF